MSDTRSLPLIALDEAIVLPGTAFAFELGSPEANAALDEVGPDGQVVLVPRVEGRFARIGVVAQLEGDPAMLPNGHRGVTLRGLHRAKLGRAEAAGGALRIDVTDILDPDDVDEPLAERMRAYLAVVEEILDARGNGRIMRFLRSIETPGALADTAGFSPDLSFAQKLQLLETLDVSERIEKATATGGPRHQVEAGFAAYFRFVDEHRSAFTLLFGSGARRDDEFAEAVRRVEASVAEAVARLIEADIDGEHRRLLAYGLVGLAEGTSRHWVDGRLDLDPDLLAHRLADLAWAGLRGVQAENG